MAGPLRNTRHERFCQLLLQGESAIDAHERAGFARSDANSSRLKANPKIAERLAALQAEVATETKVTVESICRELDEANKVAKERGQASAMVSASALRAKLAGLMVDKMEVGPAGSFDKCESVEEVVADLLRYESPHLPISEGDRRTLVEMFEAHFVQVEQFLAGLRAKPIPPEVAYKARRIELQRSVNGKARP